MRDITSKNFGLLIAFILPGFTLVWGISHVSPEVRLWLGMTSPDSPTVGGFLYVTLASIAAGMTVSTIRWAIIDPIHYFTGIRQPAWNFSMLATRVSAFETLIEIHYRFYQWYSGMLISLPISMALRWITMGIHWGEFVLLILIEVLFFVASRDTLQKYYLRVQKMLEARPDQSLGG